MGPGIILGGAALGAAQGHLDQEREKRDRKVAAETARWSPWTGMVPERVERSSGMLGGAAQGALGGASFGQGMENQDAYNQYLQSLAAGKASPASVPTSQYYPFADMNPNPYRGPYRP